MLRHVTGLAVLAIALGCDVPSDSSSAPTRPNTASQSGERAIGSKEKAFWVWFTENELRLRKAAEADAQAVVEGDPMNAELEKVHPGLLFELSQQTIDGKQEIIISADGNREVFPAVKALVQAAPPLEHWHVTAFRQPWSELDFELAMGDVVLSPQTVFYRSAPDGKKLGITIYLPGDLSEQDPAKLASFILLDHILGEYDVETRLGSIEWAVLPQDTGELTPLAELRD